MYKGLKVLSFILWIIRSFLSIWIHLGFRLFYGNQKFKLPPITNQLLLQPAIVIAKRIRLRQITVTEVVQAYVDRIQLIQPYLNAYVDERFEQALIEAAQIDHLLDNEQSSLPHRYTEEQAPFLGVPFAIKESMQFPGFHNSTGIAARKDFIATETAKAVDNMLQSGAILLCNTNVSEACMWFESRNSLYGVTNNPYDLSRTVGGSSGGAGCIVSACGVPFAVGSDIGGSIRMPSFMNGIFGHKPTPDIVSNDAQYPLHRDHHQKYLLATGPMCRYACDLQPMLKVLAGHQHIHKLLEFQSTIDLSKLRYFYIDEMDAHFVNKVDREQKKAHRRVVEHFEDKYRVHVVRLHLNRLRYPVLFWLSMMMDGKSSSEDLSLALCKDPLSVNVRREFLQKICFRSTHTLATICLLILNTIPNKHNKRFRDLAEKFFNEIQVLLGDDGVLFFPTFPVSAPYHGWPLIQNTFDYIYCGIINALGLPSTQCPLGLDSQRLPLGIQCVAARGRDKLTLAIAQEIEEQMGGWISPSQII